MNIIATARKLRRYIEDNATALTDEQALELPEAFPAWHEGIDYAGGDRVRYGQKLYKCVQAHASQDGWTPDVTPALWTEVSPEGVIPEWKQPTGAQDAYNTGDKVKHAGEIWVSNCDANIWEPGVYGWDIAA